MSDKYEDIYDNPITRYAELYWDDKVAPGGLCTLCANTGIIDTTNSAISPRGVHAGRLNYCLCKNGQSLRLKGVDMRELLAKEHQNTARSQDEQYYNDYFGTPDYLEKLELIRSCHGCDDENVGFLDIDELGREDVIRVCEAAIRVLKPDADKDAESVTVRHLGLELSRWYDAGGRHYCASTVDEEPS